MLRSDLFEVAAMPRRVESAARLPWHVAPADGEALVSWIAQLAAGLDLSPLAFCRDAIGIDAKGDPEWWRLPKAETLDVIGCRTGIDTARLKAMTLIGWAAARDDEDPDRFAARRWQAAAPSHRRGRRIDVCPVCAGEAERTCLQLTWMLGWAGVCPRHCVALTPKCPVCAVALRTETLKAVKPVDLLVCRRCKVPFAGGESIPVPTATLSLQAALVLGKRIGTTRLPGLGMLDWQTTIVLADVLLAMVWVRGSAERRRRLFARIVADLDVAVSDRNSVPWTSNYGGLLILTWLLEDLPSRLRAAIATLCTPHIGRLLDRVPNLDDEMRDRLRPMLALATTKPPQGRRAWRQWIDNMPESAADLRLRAGRERYKHRRQRLTAFAELKGGASIVAAAAIVGVVPKSLYRWLQRGASGGLEAALERPTGKPALAAYQAETIAQWIVVDRLHQNRQAIVARAGDLFGIALSLDAASKLLAIHGQPKPGRRRRLWGPKHGPRRKAGPTHDPVPGP